MSLGATTSAPASTCETAVRASSSSDWSLCTSPSTRTPQCPCEVYSHRQTSVSSTSSGKRGRSARSACWTTPSSSQAPVACSSFSSGTPKSITAWTPPRTSSSTSRTRSSAEWRDIPGSASFCSDCGATKSGITKDSRSSRVSRTSPRSPPVRRKRRSRTSGNELMAKEYGLGGEAAHAEPSRHPEEHAQAEKPGGLDPDMPPRAAIEERGAEKPNRMGKRQEVADPPGRGNRAAGHQPEEDDRQDNEHREERGRPRLACECAQQGAHRAHHAGGEQ